MHRRTLYSSSSQRLWPNRGKPSIAQAAIAPPTHSKNPLGSLSGDFPGMLTGNGRAHHLIVSARIVKGTRLMSPAHHE
jgi:hypothetical protein